MSDFKAGYRAKYKSGEPCEHKGCLNHVTHECEGCGRITGEGTIWEEFGEIPPPPQDMTPEKCEKLLEELYNWKKSNWEKQHKIK